MIKKLLDLYSVFLKIGFIGFGGGSALIPVVEKEIVEKKKWFTDEEYLKQTVIANITPGALPVKLGALAGYEMGGGFSSVACAYLITLPGVLITIILLTLFSIAGNKITHYIEFASVGISIFIINLLLIYVLRIINSGRDNNLYKSNIIICLISFILTGGKEIRNIIFKVLGRKIEALNFIVFDISTINLIILAFFMILFCGLLKNKKSIILGGIISFIYAFVNGANGIFSKGLLLSNIIKIVMIALVIYAIMKSRKEKTELKEKVKIKVSKNAIVAIGLYIGLPAILLILSIILFPKGIGFSNITPKFSGDVAISTLTSFGGGESYVSVADGFFVQSAFIEGSEFYNKVVSISNALPGPILVKIVAGIGYVFGGSIKGILYGWLIAVLGMTTAIGACCIIALIVLIGYDALKDSEELKLIKEYILPVVCGILISTSLSMMEEIMKIIIGVGINGGVSVIIGFGAVYGLYRIHKKYHLNDLIMLLSSGVISLVLLSITHF